MFDFKGKRFLITQTALWSIRGSEMVTIELAEFLQSRGAAVQVYTHRHTGPIAAMSRAGGLTVITQPRHPFRLEDYDYIWVHHQLLPLTLLEQLADPPAKMPVFVFLHMSSLDSNKLEQPYIDGFEARLASLSLFMCGEARDKFLPKLGQGHPAALFPNPAPQAFSGYALAPRPAAPRRVLMVTNSHAPALPALEALGSEIHVRGREGDSYGRVLARDFDGFDLVVTVGKTVQYCLCAGMPVFIHGHYGAPGYLTDDNLERAAHSNFTGRGFGQRKSAQDIAREIVDNYAQAAEFQSAQRQRLMERFSIDRVLPPLLQGLRPKAFEPFSQEYLAYVKGTML